MSTAEKAHATFVLVGHCGPDVSLLRAAIRRAAPNAHVVLVNDEAALQLSAAPNHVLLVNRVLDGGFHAESGVDLIRSLAREKQSRSMLISNYPAAQADAVDAGAMPGFGKSSLYAETTMNLLRAAASMPSKS